MVKKAKREKKNHKLRQYRFDGGEPLLLMVKGETLRVDPGDIIEINSRHMKTRKLRTQFTEVGP